MESSDAISGQEIRVAVASRDGLVIDVHFGHADTFRIYRAGSTGINFEGVRDVEHYCQGGYGDEDKREVILRVLSDCAAVFVARVGPGPKQRLQEAGITAVDDFPFEPVEPAIQRWFAQRVR